MVKVLFENSAGSTTEVEAKVGETLMDAAINGGIAEILAECGGACACGTCHVYVLEAHLEQTGEIEEMEEAMLEFVDGAQPNSRLSCQITVTEALNGMKVKTAVQ